MQLRYMIHEDTMIITVAELEEFKDAVRQFSISASGSAWADTKNLGAILNTCNSTKGTLAKFTVKRLWGRAQFNFYTQILL
jgi:hypothetical protein